MIPIVRAVHGGTRLIQRAALAFDGQCIDFFPSEAIKGGNHVRANTLVGLWVKVSKMQIAAIDSTVFVCSRNRRSVRHHFHTPGDAKIIHAAHQVRCCDVDRGNT